MCHRFAFNTNNYFGFAYIIVHFVVIVISIKLSAFWIMEFIVKLNQNSKLIGWWLVNMFDILMKHKCRFSRFLVFLQNKLFFKLKADTLLSFTIFMLDCSNHCFMCLTHFTLEINKSGFYVNNCFRSHNYFVNILIQCINHWLSLRH